MAVRHENVSGKYDKTVDDDHGGQSKAKFGNPINKPTDDRPKPHSTANPPKDSKDSKVG